jgi:hypothetical protein
MVDRSGRPIYPGAPFGFGVAMQAPYGQPGQDDDRPPYNSGDQYDDNGYASAGQAAVSPLQSWSGGVPRASNVDDADTAGAWRPGGFTPVPLFPDVFAPWRKSALAGVAGLLHAIRPHSNLGGMGADDPACQDEWAAARKWCDDQLQEARPERAVGYRNYADCARGMVSSRCGGNNKINLPVEPPPEPKPPKPPVDLDNSDETGWRPKEEEDCNEERNAARRQCAEQFAKTNTSKDQTGGYMNIEDCERGLVSKRCGGTFEPPKPPSRVKRYNLRPRRKR